ncbi:23S rRNA (uracil(1939)-C(5))-methyltransferase RlmD [Lachnospiraceae bacterium oral taxon 500]|nr:23S rRNA (uracil(1939)-C(5))-methyltransferase RlmD [Lachnospiraceae bacterium oral taxon 500]
MKKGEEFTGLVLRADFPNKGRVQTDEGIVTVKNAIPGQVIRGRIQKKKSGAYEGIWLETLQPAAEERPALCPVFGQCGGCTYQLLPYSLQLAQKTEQVRLLLTSVNAEALLTEIVPSPSELTYRNKMEYSFGNEYLDGELTLGLHKRGSSYDITPAAECVLVPEDFNRIVRLTQDFFRQKGCSFYHIRRRTGFLRYLILRHGQATGELMINLVTSSQCEPVSTASLLQEWQKELERLAPQLDNRIVSVLHTLSDSPSDAVKPEQVTLLCGREYYEEMLLGLRFKVSPFSFFQTNTGGAERLYQTVTEWLGSVSGKTIFDLYSGTGTITQIVSQVAKQAIGVEIVEEAVAAARENAERNGLTNCRFIAGDVLKVIDDLTERPDILVLDPPRDGIHPKALPKIIGFGAEKIIYISCKPTSLVRDLAIFQEHGYQMEKIKCVDMFPQTGHVETVCLLSRKP